MKFSEKMNLEYALWGQNVPKKWLKPQKVAAFSGSGSQNSLMGRCY